eukprot:364781-Chlamydomonas_euryale.AAC.15
MAVYNGVDHIYASLHWLKNHMHTCRLVGDAGYGAIDIVCAPWQFALRSLAANPPTQPPACML